MRRPWLWLTVAVGGLLLLFVRWGILSYRYDAADLFQLNKFDGGNSFFWPHSADFNEQGYQGGSLLFWPYMARLISAAIGWLAIIVGLAGAAWAWRNPLKYASVARGFEVKRTGGE